MDVTTRCVVAAKRKGKAWTTEAVVCILLTKRQLAKKKKNIWYNQKYVLHALTWRRIHLAGNPSYHFERFLCIINMQRFWQLLPRWDFWAPSKKKIKKMHNGLTDCFCSTPAGWAFMGPLDSIAAKRWGDREELWHEVLYVSDLQRVEREAQNNNLPRHTGPLL